jgi:hypothetical protein
MVFKSLPPLAILPKKNTNLPNRFIHTYLIPLDIAAGVDLKHLRRLRKIRQHCTGPLILEVILCGGESISRQELAALLWCHSEEIPQLRPRLHLASKWAAYTLQQYETFSKLWPVTMRTEAKRFPSPLYPRPCPPYWLCTSGSCSSHFFSWHQLIRIGD